MRTDFEDIYNNEIFNNNLYKVHLFGFMHTYIRNKIVSDIYLRSHGKYYVIKTVFKMSFIPEINTTMSIYDNFEEMKLHSHVIDVEHKESKINFVELKYYLPDKPIALDNIFIKKTNDSKTITTDMFQINEDKKSSSKYIANITFMQEVNRDEFVRNIFPDKTGNDILMAWESNDIFQKETYEKLKKETEL